MRDKPLTELQKFTRKLGWHGLELRQHFFEDDGKLITWYEAGRAGNLRDDLFLQINECPIGQTRTYAAAVYAIRYAICTGWHSMELTPEGCCNDAEVQRLDAWLHRRWFETLANRRQFRTSHPECSRWSWTRIRKDSLPYEVVDAENCVTARTK